MSRNPANSLSLRRSLTSVSEILLQARIPTLICTGEIHVVLSHCWKAAKDMVCGQEGREMRFLYGQAKHWLESRDVSKNLHNDIAY